MITRIESALGMNLTYPSFAMHHRVLEQGIHIVCSKIEYCQGKLLYEEEQQIRGAAKKRIREFTAGRILARNSMTELGLDSAPLINAENRVPIWPKGIAGSISHTDVDIGVAIAKSNRNVAIGFDMESREAVSKDLFTSLFTEREMDCIHASENDDLPTLIFSCKEAVYKSVFPITGEYLEFKDVEVDIAGGEFAAIVSGDRSSRNLVSSGFGFCDVRDQLSESVFIVTEGRASQAVN